MSKYSNWGKYPQIEAKEIDFRNGEEANRFLSLASWIPRGKGRCYGDSALGDCMINSRKHNRMLAFDAQKGILSCESGVTFEDILNVFLPKGWLAPVTPGTKFVSMGGAVASDVHGKNHHAEGCFSDYVLDFRLLIPSGEVLECSRTQNVQVFWATFGGMGLTGFVLDLRLQLKKVETAFFKVEARKTQNLAEIMALLEESENSTYAVAWTDTTAKGKNLGRSILMTGEYAHLSDLQNTQYAQNPLPLLHKQKIALPLDFPSFTMNYLSINVLNTLYFYKQFAQKQNFIQSYEAFFYPLDGIGHWNRVYGSRGFTQYQFVIPKKDAHQGIKKIMEIISQNRLGSFVSVLKTFGKQDRMLSFPTEGFTLTLDFPISERLFPILDKLDEIVMEYGGRIYLTKDVRLNAQNFRQMYSHILDFQNVIKKIDPEKKLQSLQSKRLGIHDY